MAMDGTYNVQLSSAMGPSSATTITLKVDGNSLSGSVRNNQGTTQFEGGKITGDEFEWSMQVNGPQVGELKAEFKGTVSGDDISGQVQLGNFGSATFKGTRGNDMTPDREQIRQTLMEYYRQKPMGKKNISISDVEDIGGGLTNRNYSFRLEYAEGERKYSEDLLIRIGYGKADKLREFETLEKLYSNSIPVAKVYDVGKDSYGSGFIIMEKVAGQAVFPGAMAGLTETEQAEFWKQFSGNLAMIHKLDWESEGFGFLGAPDGKYGFAKQWITMFRKAVKYAKGTEPPQDESELAKQAISMLAEGAKQIRQLGLEPVLDWLEKNMPPSEHYVLIHGDYFLHNILINGGKIAAILDWETAQIGNAAYDMCTTALMLRVVDPSGEYAGVILNAVMEHYQQITGRELKHLDYYLILKSVFFLFVMVPRTIAIPEFRVRMINTCAGLIEEKTGLKVRLP